MFLSINICVSLKSLKMKKLTKAEEEIMQIIWQLGPCTVSDIRDYMENTLHLPKPPHSTVSSIVRAMDNKNGKGYLAFKAYGRTYEYFPLVSKADYSKRKLSQLVSDYFEGSVNSLVSFLVKEEKLDLKELSDLVDQLEDENE